jgi:hypothetical protein
MVVRSEQINIIYNTIYRKTGVEQLEAAQKRIYNTINSMSSKTGVSLNRVYGGLEKANIAFDKSGNLIDMVSQKSVGYSNAQNRLSQSAARFKMEWLGLIFAGMSLEKVFGGYINQTNDMIGTTDIWNMTMTLLALGPLLDVQSGVLKISDAFMGLPESVQYGLGVVMISVTALGASIATVSQAVMGLASLKLAFPGFYGNTFGPLLSGINGVLAGFASLGPAGWVAAAAIAAAALFIGSEWDEITASMNDFGKSYEEAIKGNFDKAEDYSNLAVKEMEYAFFKFFKLDLPLMVFTGFKIMERVVAGTVWTILDLLQNIPVFKNNPAIIAGKSMAIALQQSSEALSVSDFLKSPIMSGNVDYLNHLKDDIGALKSYIEGTANQPGANQYIISPTINVTTKSNASASEIAEAVKKELTGVWYKDLQNMTRK